MIKSIQDLIAMPNTTVQAMQLMIQQYISHPNHAKSTWTDIVDGKESTNS